ncbi:MAG: hypothetical protein RBG13Loki_1810 [Promethearchaeota archaeon CR_4]|nr:MAG: hypothetical protein RBG13Loki_1810 [Candidatus Lokiarchaeota archaeon CR_4]
MTIEVPLPPLEQIWWELLLHGDYKISVKSEKLTESNLSPELKQFFGELHQKFPEIAFPELDKDLKTKFPATVETVKKELFTHPTLFQTKWQGNEKTRKKASEKSVSLLETLLNWQETRKVPDIATEFLGIISALPLSKDFPVLIAYLLQRVERWEAIIVEIETILNSLKAFLPSKEVLTPFFEWTGSTNLILNQCTKKLKTFKGGENEFLEDAQVWVSMREIIGERFNLTKLPKILENEAFIYKVYILVKQLATPKGAEQVFSLPDFVPQLKGKMKGQEKLIGELVYIFFLMEILEPAVQQPMLSKPRQREVREALEQFLLPFYAKLVVFLFPQITFPAVVTVEDIKKKLPTAINLSRKELEISTSNQSNEEIIKTFNSGIEKITRKIDALNAFLSKSQELVGNEFTIFTWLSQLHSYMQENLKRKEGEFVEFVNNVENETQKGELQEKINEITKSLELSLHSYEEKSRVLLQEKSSQLQEVEGEIKKFEKTYSDAVEAISTLIRQYGDDRHINVYSVLKNWETYISDFQKKMKFSASNLFTSLADQFKPILEAEREFLDNIRINELNPSDGETTAQWLTPPNLTLAENRQRIQSLDQRLKQLDNLREKLLQERLGVERYLAGTVQIEEKIETAQCVVCHKVINFAEDQFIKCPACNRAAHYLCLAWWLEKHNNCVVCGSEYLKPDNFSYPEDEEQSSEESNPSFSKDE